MLVFLAEQYLEFLKKITKNDLEIAAEYLVVGSILAFIKSRELLPKDEDENDEIDDLSEKLKFQILKLAEFQKLSKNLLLRKQLGIDFFKRGEYEIFSKKIKFLPKRAGERYASALSNMNLSNKVYRYFGKKELKDYVSEFKANN